MKKTLLFISGTVFIVTLVSFCLMACEQLGGDELPSAEDIIEKHLKATGGKKAHEKIQNQRTEYKIDIKTSGMEVDFTYYQERPNKAYSLLEMGARGIIRTGSDGKVAWEILPPTGIRVLEGEELANRLLSYMFDWPDAWKGLYKSVKTEGIEDVNERPCYKIVFTPNQGSPRIYYYDMKSFLLVKYISEAKNQSGTYKIETFLEDYKKVGEILSAHKITDYVMGQVIRVGVLKSIETNIEMPEGIFDLPEEIKKLISGKNDSVSSIIKTDVSYEPVIRKPTYTGGKGPIVAVDKAHFNYHTADGRYRPFASLLIRDGYRVVNLEKAFSSDSLKTVDVLVIANPLHKRNVNNWSLPTPSAFTQEEIVDVRNWVEKGGSLFLIADHMPIPGAVGDLAKSFGVEFSNGYARAGHWKGGMPNTFEFGTGLKKSAVTQGRAEDETVRKVVTFGGSAFKAPKDATPILVFGSGSLSFETKKVGEFKPDTPTVPIEGWCQGALMIVGNGRIAIFGEAAMFSAQLSGAEQKPTGMNSPEAKQNHQLLLNVMHWLTRAKGMPN